MIASGKIGEFVKQRLKPGGIFAVEQLAGGTAGRAEQGAAHFVFIDRDGIEGDTAKALLPDQLLEGRELKAVGLDAGQADSLGEDLVYDVLFCIRPLPPATKDIEDVDVRLIIQATGGDNRKIGARIRAGGQVDESADLERRPLDDGEFIDAVLNHDFMDTNRPGLRAGGTATGMRGVGCGEGGEGFRCSV